MVAKTAMLLRLAVAFAFFASAVYLAGLAYIFYLTENNTSFMLTQDAMMLFEEVFVSLLVIFQMVLFLKAFAQCLKETG